MARSTDLAIFAFISKTPNAKRWLRYWGDFYLYYTNVQIHKAATLRKQADDINGRQTKPNGFTTL
jgi:threonine/homoserine/homoserine lactone efflux protein